MAVINDSPVSFAESEVDIHHLGRDCWVFVEEPGHESSSWGQTDVNTSRCGEQSDRFSSFLQRKIMKVKHEACDEIVECSFPFPHPSHEARPSDLAEENCPLNGQLALFYNQPHKVFTQDRSWEQSLNQDRLIEGRYVQSFIYTAAT